MIFMNMEYPGKNYRVQVYDAWLGEEFEPMDNPKDGDKIVYRIIGENGQPVEQKTEVYQNGEWVEQGGGGGGDFTIATVSFDVSSSDDPVNVSFATVIPDGDFEGVSCYDQLVNADVLFVPLYKGKAILTVGGEYSFTCTGGVTYDEDDGSLVVTGDGSFTLE